MKELLIILFKDSFSNKKASAEQNGSLEQIYSITKDLDQDKFIFYEDQILCYNVLKNKGYKEYLQLGMDDQEQALNAFVKGFIKEYGSIVLIKNNFNGLSTEILQEAFIQLRSNDYVIGPSKEKNFYLLGMKKLNSCLFEDNLSGAQLRFEEIVSIIEGQNNTYHQLPELEEKKLIYTELTNKAQWGNSCLISQN